MALAATLRYNLSVGSDPLRARRVPQPGRHRRQALVSIVCGPPVGPTSAEVVGIKGACDRVAGCAVAPTLQTFVLLLGRVKFVVAADSLPGRGEGHGRG